MATFANAQLSGTYTINSDVSQNPDYASFGAAASALAAGVSGQVIFEVAPGTYEEYVTLNSISGSSAANRFCDYNRIAYTGDNVGIYAGDDCSDLNAWSALTGFDENSAVCTPEFVGGNDLHITSSDGLTVAHPLGYVTTDIDGETRSATPCAGADEYESGTNLPPVVANPLAPIHFTDYPQSFSFDISECFDDPDNNNSMMTYAVQSCPSEITVSIDGNDMLQVSRATSDAFSNRTLVVRATSNGKHVDMNVDVSGDEVVINVDVADFEDVVLGSSGIWQPMEGNNEMLSHGWAFTNYYSEYFWGGFTASNRTNLNQTGMGAQYTAVTGVGHDGSTQYAVAYTYGAQTDVYAADGESHTVTGCYVTNNLWAYQNMLEGDYAVTPFGGPNGTDPDWFKLTATGKNASGQTVGTLDFYLADYRFDDPEEDYILNTWEWFDLSPLGEVVTISFSLESTKQNYGGMITPAYFCMDDFNGKAPGTIDEPPYVVNSVPDVIMDEFPKMVQIDLNGVVTDDDDPDELIEYSLISNSNEVDLSATLGNKILVLNRLQNNESVADVTLRATSDGQYVDFVVHVVMHVVEGVGEIQARVGAYPNPTRGQLTLSVAGSNGFGFEVYNAMGQKVMGGSTYGDEASIDLSASPKGMYVISICCDGNSLMLKVEVY